MEDKSPLDVMYIEKNVFNNVFNIVMDIKDRTKDNVNVRMDIQEYCHCKELKLVERGEDVETKGSI